MRALHSSHRESGMTLIEVMIAVAIVTVVASLVYSGLVQTIKNKERVEAETDRSQEVTTVMSRMARELQSAYVSAQINPIPTLQAMKTCFVGSDSSGNDRLDFTSFSHQRLYRDAKESDQNELSYFIARDPNDNSKKVLARREQNRVDDDAQKGGEIHVALENVDELDFEYLDPITIDWVKSWDTTQVSGQPNRLPVQVKIRIKTRSLDGRNHSHVFGTRVSIPIRWGLNFTLYQP